jgi:hypothetical protein
MPTRTTRSKVRYKPVLNLPKRPYDRSPVHGGGEAPMAVPAQDTGTRPSRRMSSPPGDAGMLLAITTVARSMK